MFFYIIFQVTGSYVGPIIKQFTDDLITRGSSKIVEDSVTSLWEGEKNLEASLSGPCKNEVSYIKNPCNKTTNLCFVSQTCGENSLTAFCPAPTCFNEPDLEKKIRACSGDSTYSLTETFQGKLIESKEPKKSSTKNITKK